MRREERRRKFHEALINTLYPKSPQTQHQHTNVDPIPDEYGLVLQQSSDDGGGNVSDDNDNNGENKKLSRSQRKRIRKKKIKQDIGRRKNIIGPLLCSPNLDDDQPKATSDVRQNASDDNDDNNSQGEAAVEVGSKQKKIKQRREAKKLAKDHKNSIISSCSSSLEDQHTNFNSKD